MAKGILNIQAADGAVIGLHVPDGLTSGERQIALGTNLSGITAYHLLQGNLAVSASTITQGFNTTLYTGNGSTQSITTGIDMSTQWGNTAEEMFGGLNWVKNRISTPDHVLFDSVNGNNFIRSNATNANTVATVPTRTSTGLNVTVTDGGWNGSGIYYASWNFQTTHRKTGTTNHGQAYECHYNPFTGFTMVKYAGSGLAGHEIPHMLGRSLDFVVQKNLTSVANWLAYVHMIQKHGVLNLTDAISYDTTETPKLQTSLTSPANGAYNTAANTYIMYGWANSYFDKANKLIGNYEIGVYQGTGVSGNKVLTRGKPAWVMIKRTDNTANWVIFDNKRQPSGNDGALWANLSGTEDTTGNLITFNSDGFTHLASYADGNVSGGQYLYIVAYDTNANGGGTYYPLASDTANVQVNNALIPIAQGIDSNGAKNTILSKNETFSGVTYTQGKNYPYYDALGNRGVSNKAPNYGTTNPANGGDFYNVLSNKWYTSAGVEITNGRNYLNHIVYADNDGGVLYVEELPKIEYKDIVKANEFRGKNACTAWANVSSSVILLDNYNFSAVTFKSGNAYKLYFKEPMDNTNYVVVGAQNETYIDTSTGGGFAVFNKTLTSFEYICPSNTYNTNNHIIVIGGKS